MKEYMNKPQTDIMQHWILIKKKKFRFIKSSLSVSFYFEAHHKCLKLSV